MSRTLRGLAAAAFLIALGPVAAHAQSGSLREPAGDVTAWQPNQEDPFCEMPTTVAPPTGADSADITRLGVHHSRRDVVVTVRFADLEPTGRRFTEVSIGTPRDRWLLDLDDKPGRAHPRADLSPEPRWEREGFDSDGDGVDDCDVWLGSVAYEPCHSVTAAYDAARNRIRTTIPRRCLGNPRWVEVGARANEEIDGVLVADEWDPSAGPVSLSDTWSPDAHVYGARYVSGPVRKHSSSKPSRVTRSSTEVRHSFARSLSGLPIAN